ncbi:acyl-CoA dehydrogenase [Thermogymnomonas acidicola]|uniref:Acyl-CoA dehydrogenase n=1 Tax=Thermogymnomonas acidicola TaxID=399579 RepID=A0AA37BQV3_9ARCH|nr:acyl-CoA dehydrogenase family protein [Thermogymnomonas acidicola]GGM71698.1 acyl-CoA dehydrogenase [Thermogymnomonas acidicola]
MLSFEFSEDQELLRSSVREFCTRTIAPRIRDMIRERRIPKEVYDGLARMGLLGMTVPQEYGGMGADAVTTGIAAEEIARADPTCSIPVLFLVDNAWSYLVSKYGSSELRESILPDVARGKKIVGIASTEPNFGSDIASMRTTATLQDGMYVVNGEKSFISLVRDVKEIGGGFVTVTKTSPDKGSRGVTLLFIPYSDGMSVRYLEEMGREGSSWGAITFENVRVQKENVIGSVDQGFKIIHEGFEFARALIAVISAATALKSISNGAEYMKSRIAFGSPIAKFQGLQFQLADDVARMEAALTMGYRALWTYDQEQRHGKFSRFQVSREVAIAKLISTTWAFEAINDAMQWQGAYGYSKDCPEEWALRGIRSFLLAEGSREVMKTIIARETLGREYIR